MLEYLLSYVCLALVFGIGYGIGRKDEHLKHRQKFLEMYNGVVVLGTVTGRAHMASPTGRVVEPMDNSVGPRVLEVDSAAVEERVLELEKRKMEKPPSLGHKYGSH